MKKQKKGFTLIELLISLGIISLLFLSISLYNKIRFQKNIDDIISDVFYSNSNFKEKTAFANPNDIRYSGEDGKYFITSNFPIMKNDKSDYGAIWFGQHYYKHNLGYSIIQRDSKGHLIYRIVLTDESNKKAACIKLMNHFINNENVLSEYSTLNYDHKFSKLEEDKKTLQKTIANTCNAKEEGKEVLIILALDT